MIGNGVTVQDGAHIGPRALVAAGATIAPDTRIDEETLVLGEAARRQRPLTNGARWWVDTNPATYQELARRHRDGVSAVD